MIRRGAALALCGGVLAVALGGCETSADKSERLEAQAATTTTETGLRIGRSNPRVRVLDTAALSDANGTAVVVRLRDTGPAAMAEVPIAIDVRDGAGTSIFRNDAPGTDPGLTSAPLLAPGRDVVWVHDQVQAVQGAAKRVSVRVGEAKRTVSGTPPRLTIGPLKLTGDPSSGTEGLGRITNGSDIVQRRLTIYAIARRGSKVVAAGRAVVNRLGARRAASFAVYFIGDPRGARITLSAPPTVLS